MIWIPNGVASGDNDALCEHIPREGSEDAVRSAGRKELRVAGLKQAAGG